MEIYDINGQIIDPLAGKTLYVAGDSIAYGKGSAGGSKKQQFWPGTLYQCKVYKGLLSDNRIKAYINKGW